MVDSGALGGEGGKRRQAKPAAPSRSSCRRPDLQRTAAAPVGARGGPAADLNRLDNVDKHRLLQQAFVYPGVERGVDLIEIVDPARVRVTENLWTAGQRLDNGTPLVRFLTRGKARGVVRAYGDAVLGFASGELGLPRIGYTDMIARVRAIAARAAAVSDGEADSAQSRHQRSKQVEQASSGLTASGHCRFGLR